MVVKQNQTYIECVPVDESGGLLSVCKTSKLTLPLADSELQALEGVVIGIRVRFTFWVVIFSQVRVGETLLGGQPPLRVQQ